MSASSFAAAVWHDLKGGNRVVGESEAAAAVEEAGERQMKLGKKLVLDWGGGLPNLAGGRRLHDLLAAELSTPAALVCRQAAPAVLALQNHQSPCSSCDID